MAKRFKIDLGKNYENPCHSKKSPKKTQEKNKYIYGNYPYYYGYRKQEDPQDNRLHCMKREWLTGKDVLDIGCNAGHLTLDIARDFSPKAIVGLDIDGSLVNAAKKNTVYYLQEDAETESSFPIGLLHMFGPFAKALIPGNEDCEGKFPFNVTFIQGNYVLDSDDWLKEQYPEFDTILCLSVTKWIHLNWGDEGIKRMFHRIYYHLRPGGFLILEAQPFSSYRKKKRMSDDTYKHFCSMKFFPQQFNEFLLKDVGFETCELVDTPAHSSKGFCRPIYLFTKGYEATERESAQKPTHIFFDSSESELSDLSTYEELSE